MIFSISLKAIIYFISFSQQLQEYFFPFRISLTSLRQCFKLYFRRFFEKAQKQKGFFRKTHPYFLVAINL